MAATAQYNPTEFSDQVARLSAGQLTRRELVTFGLKLSDSLLPSLPMRGLVDRVFSSLGSDDRLRLRVVIRDRELMRVPWELAQMPRLPDDSSTGRFPAFNPHVSIVRLIALSGGAPPSLGAHSEWLRLLPVAVNPDTFPVVDVDRERSLIEQALKGMDPWIGGASIEELPFVANPSLRDLTGALRRGADVFHFAGHGWIDQRQRNDAYLVLVRDTQRLDPYLVAASDIASILNDAGVRLVVLDACDSAPNKYSSALSGVAPALVENGVPAVVAMQYCVPENAAIKFFRTFYASVAGGFAIDEAVLRGRTALVNEQGVAGDAWGAPALFLRSASTEIFPELAQRRIQVDAKLRIATSQSIDTVAEGGSMTGIKIDRLGG
jgi:hypothetical protein